MVAYNIQPVFSRGELSPKLRSRADLEQFKTGLGECLNWMVMRQGGVRRRPGTKFIGEVRNSNKPARVIPFIFKTGQTYQAYVLVLNDSFFRVYALDGRVGSFEVAHPYADADLFGIDYDQTNDVLDLTHKSYAPRRISRTSDTSWSIGPVTFRFGPYLPVNATATTLTPSATGNPIPIMTSNTLPSGTANASSGATTAFRAFDGDSGTFWESGTKSDWLSYAFPAVKIITGYSVQSAAGQSIGGGGGEPAALKAPKTWTFEGFDGTNWIVLDSQFGQTTWSDGEVRYFRFTGTVAYIAYRLNVSAINGGIDIAVANLAMTESTTTAPPVTLTASSTTGINGGTGFTNADIGRIVALLDSTAVYRAFVIVTVSSTTVVTAVLDDAPLSATTGTLQWRLGGWGNTPGWPAHVATFEQRKIYARTDAQPSGIWGTKSGAYGAFLDFSVSVPIKDDDSISFLLTDVNEIQWLSEGQDLLIGTAGASRTMGRDSPNLAFSANNFRQSKWTGIGSQAIRPAQSGDGPVFVAAFGKALREFAANDSGVGYNTPDISVLSDHLFASGVIELAYQQEPDSTIWGPVGNGELVGLTYEKAQSMAGMHHHQLGGGGIVESCCTIPGNGINEVWMIVKRTIGGVTKRYIERMLAPFDSTMNTLPNAWYVDCGLQYQGSPVTTVSGLGHLEGLTVSILADGAREADAVVTGGSVSLASGRAASNIIVGLPYTSRLKTLPSAFSQGDGSGLGRRKKVVKIIFDVLDTGDLKSAGKNSATAEEIIFRNTSDNLGSAPPLHRGFHPARPETSWNDDGEVTVIADGPLPATVRSITLALESEP